MRWIYFIARVAFLCNLAFLFCVLLQYTNLELNQDLVSLLIILGWVMAIAVNTLSNILVLVALLRKRLLAMNIPSWLTLANFLFLIFEVYYLIIHPHMLYDSYHP